MTTSTGEFPRTDRPTREESKLAEESGRALGELLKSRKKGGRLFVGRSSGSSELVEVPKGVLQLLAAILDETAQGNAVAVVPVEAELTTQQAADLLQVSRPHLVDLLDEGEIPHRKVGTHRRVLFQDVMSYKQKSKQNRLKALEELSALDQELGLGY
ncbi:MAG: excisionase family DNA-binding protein [Paludisphaera borealis]|uniref:helix-turn-helix domain-containing protein n=1 Tax=Paludisphaera borealis TaxID=1387353 RepID=UPI002848EFCC|nr:excisionase family DNA-binding protein [Paludisphaera borealis]MDR3622415.1 excisionase family DNA-binding protein [Paludisphaera borealis]